MDISQELKQIRDALIENGGELTPEMEPALQELTQALDEKADAYCHVIDGLEGEAEIIAAEIKRLQDRAKTRKNAAAKLRERLRLAMEITGKPKFSTPLHDFTICQSPMSIRWEGKPDEIPELWQKIEVKVSLDTDAVKAALKAGDELPVGVVAKRGTHLRVS